MNNLERQFVEKKASGEKLLVLYVTAGDPDLSTTLEIMVSMAENGVDSIELGIPFSDPIADGPVIQRSSARALVHKTNLSRILDLLRKFRQKYETPVVLMGYYNPILNYGIEKFVNAFKQAGGDGMIVADLPYEEGEELERLCTRHDISLIYLLAPDVEQKRARQIVTSSRGFIYCVSHYGTTGETEMFEDHIKEVITSLREFTQLPVLIGFGISSVDKARTNARIADGIIIGSWLIKELENADHKSKHAGQFTRRIKEAIIKG